MPARRRKTTTANTRRKKRGLGLWIVPATLVGLLVLLAVLFYAVPHFRASLYTSWLGRKFFPRPTVVVGPPALSTGPLMEGYDVHGIDISRYQGVLDWEKVNQAPIDFVFMKATEGISLKDPCYDENWEKAANTGILRGAYHFFHPTLSAKQQAKWFIEVSKLGQGDLPPVLDFEIGAFNVKKLRRELQTWLDEVERHYKAKPVIYTNYKLYRNVVEGHFDGYPIWLAHYTPAPNDRVTTVSWMFWQYSELARIEGLAPTFDFNVFGGTRAQLDSLCLKGQTRRNQ